MEYGLPANATGNNRMERIRFLETRLECRNNQNLSEDAKTGVYDHDMKMLLKRMVRRGTLNYASADLNIYVLI